MQQEPQASQLLQNAQAGDISGYAYPDSRCACAHQKLLPALLRTLEKLRLPPAKRRIFELGCGNGSLANQLTLHGFDVTGVDPSREGILQANQAYAALNLREGSAYDDLQGLYGRFPVVLSLEVVEHVYYPRAFAACVYSLLEEGGTAILSTPYHGYIKNLALAVSGKMDRHFTALWDHGHIKFWSRRTLARLLAEAGFKRVRFLRVGRLPSLAKSMIAIARK